MAAGLAVDLQDVSGLVPTDVPVAPRVTEWPIWMLILAETTRRAGYGERLFFVSILPIASCDRLVGERARQLIIAQERPGKENIVTHLSSPINNLL